VISDLDLVLTIFDCLFDRYSFFQTFEKYLQQKEIVSEIVIVWDANVPLCKFKVGSISVDLVFAEIQTPDHSVPDDYLEQPHNIASTYSKSIDCLNSYLMMKELRRILVNMDQNQSGEALQVFS
jgi:poly(A) polymerase Pap1